MTDQKFIQDRGLFIGQQDTRFYLSESFETIYNLLRTIREYREYAQPGSATWQEYVQEFFQVLGLSTDRKSERLFLLKDIESESDPRMVAGFTMPGESFEEITPWLHWSSFLCYAASYYQVDWGILTNGIELKVFSFKRKDFNETFFWANLDGIISDNRLDSFFAIYKLFSFIRNRKEKPSQVVVEVRKRRNHEAPVEKALHVSRSLLISDDKMPKALLNILEVYQETAATHMTFNSVCKIIANKRGVSTETIRDACTRRIKLNVSKFINLSADKDKLCEYLCQLFPTHTSEIRQAILG